jgi:hypothetical protein
MLVKNAFSGVFFGAIKKDLYFYKSLISKHCFGGASRIRTADLWIMTKKFIKKPYESTVFFWCEAR